MKIILINGKARSGKDFAAQILQKKLEKTVKLAFADSIKDILCNTLGITINEFDDYKNNFYDLKYANQSLTFRELIQKFGETIKSELGDNIWAKRVIDKIYTNNYTNTIFIISDFRFPVEYKEIVKTFGKDRIITLQIQDKNASQDEHISENALKDFKFDYIIDNTDKKPEVLEDYLQSFIDLKVL
jgi:hypothetical protein